MHAVALYFLLHSNFIQYPNNLLCISMKSNAFSRLIAAHIYLFLAVDHVKSSLIFFYDLVLF